MLTIRHFDMSQNYLVLSAMLYYKIVAHCLIYIILNLMYLNINLLDMHQLHLLMLVLYYHLLIEYHEYLLNQLHQLVQFYLLHQYYHMLKL